jgi:hypothetical protein
MAKMDIFYFGWLQIQPIPFKASLHSILCLVYLELSIQDRPSYKPQLSFISFSTVVFN